MIDNDSPPGAWERELKARAQKPLEVRKPQTVDTIQGFINLGKLNEAGVFDLISSRFLEISIPPGATVAEVEALLVGAVRVALARCREEAFPHG